MLIPPHALFRDFLPRKLNSELLQFAVGQASHFSRATVYQDAVELVDPQRRHSQKHAAGLGPFKRIFLDHVQKDLSAIFEGAGMPPRSVTRYETELVRYGNQGHFRRHVDTLSSRLAKDGSTTAVRTVSCVYYFFKDPRPFTGGQLRLFSFDGEGSKQIDPLNNSLLVFPSFAPHEVLPVSCPSESPEDYRFSINCWLHCDLSG
jgi:SM-20-related protein